ncbi:amidohydrolase family protein, partial [Ruminococcaceae bacterium OttesenSCG-928-D13]|nr:amidohydrolase family protein [Ruminococcaceae bacterium OttesenSCG-928-D13]
MKDIAKLIEVATGRQEADLVLKGGSVVNVFTGEVLLGDVAISGGYVAAVGNYSGPNEIDCTGRFICPGFIDAHIHIESTMVLPGEFVRLALPSGTTTVIADPHEIVNVLGEKGLEFMLEVSRGLPCNLYYMLPSSVPSTAFETAGGRFTAADMEKYLNNPQVLGLGEAMSYTDVVAGRGEIMKMLELFKGRLVDGHSPGLSSPEIQAYVAAGVCTEHENTTFDEALEKARAGMAILVREGSAAHDLTAIVNGMLESGVDTGRFMFCTDDKHLDDLGRDGHIRWNVKLAIDMGLDPVKAIQMASWNTAQVYGLRDTGAVAPGYKADILVLKSLRGVEVEAVYKDGVPAEKRIAEITPPKVEDPDILRSVKARKVCAADFALKVQNPTDVIEMVPYQLVTKHLREEVPTENGCFVPSPVYTKLCVIERHGKNGNISV